MSQPACRTCGGESVRHVGKLPEVSEFAGRRLGSELPGGDLWRCSLCGFVFRSPLLADDTYQHLYRTGALDVWDTEQRREDFRLIRHYLQGFDANSIDILDVGCYTGQLLASMPKTFRLFGIETNKQAALVAASKGITVIAETVQELGGSSGRYDVITACDVIEHVANPLDFLKRLRALLKPGGQVLVTTGNCDALLWQVFGARYWYCFFPEHISFIGSRWIQTLPQQVNLKLIKFTSFNYLGGALSLKHLVLAALYRFSPELRKFLLRLFGRSTVNGVPPGSGATKDHMLCVFEAT
jgi:2-polyprenyl-3-methyl-5-hydroxy-6-metoxy-1,4-benzoquinol methylase